MNLIHEHKNGLQNPISVVIISTSQHFKDRVMSAVNEFHEKTGQQEKISFYSNFSILSKSLVASKSLIISDETALEMKEDLFFLKALKDKNPASTLVHIYDKYSPAFYENVVIRSVSKFVKQNVSLEQNLTKSLNALFLKKRIHEN